MNRLTKHGNTSHENGVCCTHFNSKECREVSGNCALGCQWEEKVWSKLAEYEDLEEKGLLLKLPCKIGDTVYAITRNFISEYLIWSIEKYNEGFFFNWRCEKGIYKNVCGFTDYEIGKSVFLTKEAAEQKLKEKESAE